MRITLFAAALGLGLLSAPQAQAQRVSADILIGGGPVAGRLFIGDPYPAYRDVYVHRRPVRRVVVQRYAPRIIVVERFDHRGRRAKYHRQSFRRVHAYYDGRSRYYDRYQPGLREVTVYEQNGRYYRDDDDRNRAYDDDRHDRSRDDRGDYRHAGYDDN